MTKEDLAAILNGREYCDEMTTAEEEQAKEDGLVAVFGSSDALVELRGAISDELGAFNGRTFLVHRGGVLPCWDSADTEAEAAEYFRNKSLSVPIQAVWCGDNGDDPIISWMYRTEIPHATFEVVEDGEVYCRGIVFSVNDLPAGGGSHANTPDDDDLWKLGPLYGVRLPLDRQVVTTEGAARIGEERFRQIGAEGYSSDHDDRYTNSELVRAAIIYVLFAGVKPGLMLPPSSWPWDAQFWKPSGDAIRDLERAGALIAAEIDRRLRLKAKRGE